MKAVICHEPGRLELIERDRPQAPGPGDVRLAVSHVGICGTDYHIFEGKHPFLEYPRVMGHEVSARVIEAGEGVTLAIGTPVIVNPYIACGTCIACRKDKPNCCTRIRVLGVHTDGAFCEEIIVPAINLYPAQGISLEAAAAVEFLAIGAHAVRRSLAPAGSRSLVIGAGPIGLGTAIFSRIAGHDVTIADMSSDRLAVAESKLGFSSVVAAGEGFADRVRDLTGGDGFDVVFDATGNAKSMAGSLDLVAHGGTLVFVSVVKDDITFADPEFHKREMMLIGSRNATRVDFEHVLASMAAGKVPLDVIITHRTSLHELPHQMPGWAHNKDGLIKAVIGIGG